MDENLSELERLELAKKWWRENYKPILSGALIAFVVVGGWRYWQYRVEARGETASTLFVQLSAALAVHDQAAATKLGDQIMKDYDDTPYASQAAFALAQLEATAGKIDDGEQKLNWVMQHSKDDGLKLLARLRLARLQFAAGNAQAALDTLGGVDAGGFAPLYAELKGDAYTKLGKTDEARAAYKQALDAWTDALGDRSLVQMKLDALGQKAAK